MGQDTSRVLIFERRTGEHFGWRRDYGLRVVGTEDLLGGFLSMVLEAPHVMHAADWRRIEGFVPDRIFSADHDPALYHLVAQIAFLSRNFFQRWKGGEYRYPAKYHLQLALRRIVEPEPGLTAMLGEGYRSPALKAYIARLQERLWADDIPARTQAAHEVVQAACADIKRGFSARAAKSKELTAAVMAHSAKRRVV